MDRRRDGGLRPFSREAAAGRGRGGKEEMKGEEMKGERGKWEGERGKGEGGEGDPVLSVGVLDAWRKKRCVGIGAGAGNPFLWCGSNGFPRVLGWNLCVGMGLG